MPTGTRVPAGLPTGAGPGRAATIRAVTDRSPHPLSLLDPGAPARDEIAPRVGGGHRRRRAARPAARQPAGRDRGRAAGQPRARRLRDQPRDEAGPAVPDGAAARSRRRSPRELAREAADDPAATPIAAVEVAPPGFLNLRLARRGARDDRRRRSSPSPDDWGRVAPAGAAVGQRRVRVGQPDRAAARRQRPRRVRRRPAVPGPRGRRPAGHARVLLQRLGRAGPEPRRVGGRAPARRAGPRGRLPGRLRRTTWPATLPDDVWAAATAPGADTDGDRRPLGGRPGPRGHRGAAWPTSASGSTSGRARRALHDEGWVERAVERLRERGHVYEQDGAIWFRSTDFGDDKDRVIYPLERRADLLRRRHRLRHREVQPRLRPPHLHLGRRPPRHGRPGPQRRRGDGLRPGRGPDAALLAGSASSATARRSRCRSGPASSSPSTSCWPRSASMPRAGSSRHARPTTGIDFDIELAKKQSNENPVYYVQYAHARIASILRKAADAGLAPAAGVDGLLAGRARGRAGPRRSRASPRSSRTPWPPRRRRASRPTRPSSRRPSTPSTATRGSSTPASRSGPRRGSRSPRAARITLANALGLLGISAPESM